MIKKYFYTIILFTFCVPSVQAQFCPPAANTLLGGTRIVFNYDPGTSFCINRPDTITVGSSTFELDEISCADEVSFYNLVSGPAIVGSDFVVDSGFETSCSYSSGTLPITDFEALNNSLKIYPNPVSGNTLNIRVDDNINAKISLYNVTGKRVLYDDISNKNYKNINVSSLTNGVYMLKIQTDVTSVTRKVIIM